MRACHLAALAMAFCVATAAAQDMRTQDMRTQDMRAPRIVRTPAEWNEVAAQLGMGTEPGSIERLNEATEKLFTNIGASPVPVLLPFNSAQLLRDAAAGAPQDAVTYLIDVRPPPFFQAGPGGYDAVFSVRAKEMPGSDVLFSNRIDVQISGSTLLYELDEPAGIIGWPVNGRLGADFPGIRRVYLEGGVRYTFVRFGVPYVVSIDCHDGGTRFHKMSCREADRIAIRVLRSLQVAGGTPQPQPGPVIAETIERPEALSPTFTYHSPGDLLPGSGMRGHSGRTDYTVYSKMRFPLAEAPAFANSQSFNHWGDCDQTGRVSLGQLGKTALYRCRVNNELLVADESVNYAYPWRDNFCEHRFFYVGECPGGRGHQGQDIRPSSCKQRIEGANRCEPYQHDVVAVRDGIVLRAPGEVALHIVTNTANERLRFRYLHMFPKQLDQDGVLSGRAVREGEVIGKVGNYLRSERATTYHLHFDMQVPTKYGWAFVNPYMSLVAAYERQIEGRGRELDPDGTPIAAGPAVVRTPVSKPEGAATFEPEPSPWPVPDTASRSVLDTASTSVPDTPPPAVIADAPPAPAVADAPPPAVVADAPPDAIVTAAPPAPADADAPPPAVVADIPSAPAVAEAAVADTPLPPAANPVPPSAANPVKIEVQSAVTFGIGSDTAAHERSRSKQP